jgi:hypothetical protein
MVHPRRAISTFALHLRPARLTGLRARRAPSRLFTNCGRRHGPDFGRADDLGADLGAGHSRLMSPKEQAPASLDCSFVVTTIVSGSDARVLLRGLSAHAAAVR